MGKTRSRTEMNASWPENNDQLPGTDMVSDCIDRRPNLDGTLDYTPVPQAFKNLWLFKNGGERNEVC
ncbi:MAG: hypothetical protein WC294_03280 [Methanoregula sp.]